MSPGRLDEDSALRSSVFREQTGRGGYPSALVYTRSVLAQSQPRSAATSAALLHALSLIRGVKHVKEHFYMERDMGGVAAAFFPFNFDSQGL